MIDKNDNDENYVCRFNLDDTYEFEIMVPKYMDEILEEDDERNPFYLNFVTNQHYEG